MLSIVLGAFVQKVEFVALLCKICRLIELNSFTVILISAFDASSKLTLLVPGDFFTNFVLGGGVFRPPLFLRNYKRYNNKTYSHCSLDTWLLKYNNDN